MCEASGATKPLETALGLVRPEGQVTKVGFSPQQAPIDMNLLVQKNVRLQGSFSHNYPMWERVIHLLAAGKIPAELVVGLKKGIRDWEAAFGAMDSGKVIKSVLLPA